ncbi:GDSL-type esterase/lipase family protein [Alicyclobacillus sp.]|uniref:GDSL-type esterase/lipase family protein n=1 Tax=Alicyclobacillus sp. TaxID=61169 RepID=UPI0025C4F243|nr:GDSL-type esterase/lipase family protein [Alicyclobacillus sp.]MCL6517558.1 hypothetical protein [Alicyclobacillus sp.]
MSRRRRMAQRLTAAAAAGTVAVLAPLLGGAAGWANPAVWAGTAGAGGSTGAVGTTGTAGSGSQRTLQQPKEGVLVALGDSITFGYNLDDTNGNTTPSHAAYPYQIGKDTGYSVVDLGVPGWDSQDLRTALGTPNFARAIRSATVITLDIGSNDLLRLAGQLHLLDAQKDPTAPVTISPEQQAQFAQAIETFGANLTSILTTIRTQTQAPIILYNLYNPFPAGTGLNTVTERFEQAENGIIAQAVQSVPNVALADVHTRFAGRQAEYVRITEKDVHPTVAGQTVLAEAGESALRTLGLPSGGAGDGGADDAIGLAAGSVGPGGGSVGGSLNGSRVSLTVPAGAISAGTEVDLTSGPTSAVGSLLSKGQRAVAEVGVNFMAFVRFSKPYTLTIANPSIPADAAVFQITGDVLTPVAGAKVTAGQVEIPGTAGGDYIVIAPEVQTVPGATAPETGLPVWPAAVFGGMLMIAGTALVAAGRRKRA